MPPCLGSAANAIDDTASDDSAIAAASTCTPRMFLSLDISALLWAYLSNDSMAEHRRNQQGRCPYWQFGLRSPRATDARSSAQSSHFQLVAALEVENLAGLVRGRHLEAETFD